MIYWFKKYFTDSKAHFDALYEVLVTGIFSLVPFVIAAFVVSAKQLGQVSTSLDVLLGKGQLYLLAYGVYGTIFWLAFVKGDKPRHGARIFFGLLATVLVFPIVGFLGVDPTFSTVLNPSVVAAGYWIYGLFLVLNYLLLFYMNVDPPQPGEVFNREAETMRGQYRNFSNG